MKSIYKIYQPNHPTFRVDKKQEIYFDEDFRKVYESEYIPEDNQKDIQILELLFEKFNIAHPSDFRGHSLSVGDIVELQVVNEEDSVYDFEEEKEVQLICDRNYYICCNCGWQKIDFILTKEYIEQADSKLYQQMRG
ncbi:MAG: hypothetical protein IJ122_06180 [Methanobrevibacter sp.]|nr:hypothetical protein [Methanobrevibacter sp.]